MTLDSIENEWKRCAHPGMQMHKDTVLKLVAEVRLARRVLLWVPLDSINYREYEQFRQTEAVDAGETT